MIHEATHRTKRSSVCRRASFRAQLRYSVDADVAHPVLAPSTIEGEHFPLAEPYRLRAVERTATTKPTAAEPCSTPWYRLTKRSALSFFDVSLWGRKASGDKDAAARVAWCRAPRHEARPPAAAAGGRWARVPDCERLAVRRGRNESALRAARESPAGGGPLATSSQSPRIRPEGPLTGQSRRLRSQQQPVRARAAPRRRL